MLKENEVLFKELRISEYHAAGFLGQGRHVVVLDSTNSGDHQRQIVNQCAEIAPLMQATYLNRREMRQTVDWIKLHREEIDAINCSWHSPPDPIFEELLSLGIPIFCASGNESNPEVNYPGSLPKTISVGAWDRSKGLLENYSNWGANTNCVMYDDFYWLTATTGLPMNNTGTSFCSPVVMAMMMLLPRKYNDVETAEFISRNCMDLMAFGFDEFTGYGLFILPKLEDLGMEIKLTVGSNNMLVDGVTVPIDSPPVLINGRVMVPLRAPFEAAGMQVSWDALTKTATIRSDK